MKDGLYQVTLPWCCAGFVVRDGRVVKRAPILKRFSLDELFRLGVRVQPTEKERRSSPAGLKAAEK